MARRSLYDNSSRLKSNNLKIGDQVLIVIVPYVNVCYCILVTYNNFPNTSKMP